MIARFRILGIPIFVAGDVGALDGLVGGSLQNNSTRLGRSLRESRYFHGETVYQGSDSRR